MTLDQLLARVVERKGYSVQGTDPEALFARKGDDTLLAAWKTDGALTTNEATIFLSAMEQVHAKSGILVAPQGAEPAAKDLLAAKGVDVWAESRLVLEVGEALVADAIAARGPQPQAPGPAPQGASRFPPTPAATAPETSKPLAGNKPTGSLIATATASMSKNTGAAYFMPNKKKEQPADMQATIGVQKGGALGYAWGGVTGGTSNAGIAQVRSGRHPSKKVDQWGNLVPPGQAQAQGQAQAAPAKAATVNAEEDAYEIITTPKKKAVAAATAQGPPPGASNTLKLAVTKEDALAKAGAKGGAIVKLALVPHVAFEYDLHLEREGLPEPIEGKGAVLVSSLTGDLRTVERLDYNATEPTDARKEQEKLQAVDVYDKVKGYMLKTYSRTLSVEKEIAGNTVMENLKVTPDPEEMGLQHRGIVYVPVWEITGGGVNAKVDAFTGQAL